MHPQPPPIMDNIHLFNSSKFGLILHRGRWNPSQLSLSVTVFSRLTRFHVSKAHCQTNSATPYPPCQMYRYDGRQLPAGLINASWECRLARCRLCSHGNWLQPCVWPHGGHTQKPGYRKSARDRASPHVSERENPNGTVTRPSLTWSQLKKETERR